MSRLKMNKRALMFRITQVGERATKGLSTVMREEAEKLAELARDYAPVDEGNLEEAIQTKFDYEGINGRLRASVFIKMGMVVDRETGKRISHYAMAMHEGLAPHGSGAFKLGPLSRQKAAGGKDVGGKFMERAAAQRIGIIYQRAHQIVQRQLK